MHSQAFSPLVLIILDGFGYRADPDANAVAQANKPHWDTLWQHYPHTLLSGSGRCVGLPEGQMGNSEVGHLTMGAGRLIQQDLTRIDAEIESELFFHNPVLCQAITDTKKTGKTLHVMGLLSPGGVHSHEHHFHALLRLAAQHNLSQVCFHLFLDGRDTPPQSALDSIQALDSLCTTLKTGKIVSLIGRYYAMDRDHRWDRIEKTYQLLVEGKADYTAPTAAMGLSMAYQRGETDEFVNATSIHPSGASATHLNDDDTLIFMNFRSDRAREITQALIDPQFTSFPRFYRRKLHTFVSLTEYDPTLPTTIAYPSRPLTGLFGEYISAQGLNQLRLAETEKYAHVTFFFNGGREIPYPNEDRQLIPSPKIATYDLQPEMSAYLVTDHLIQAIEAKKHHVIICNFANPDMVGHTGNFAATVKAIEVIDTCLGRITKAIQDAGGEMIITADHGNAERMYNEETCQAHTAHTSDPVPFIYVGRPALITQPSGGLSDIAPTLLYLLGLKKPDEMTGSSLVELRS